MRSVAVVTGGSRGIGAATAVLLARRGWDVCIGFRAAAASARQVVAECKAAGVAAVAVPTDVTSPDAVAALFMAADAMGPVAALVNNAGIVAGPARVEEMTHDRLVAMFAVNVVGAFLCAGHAIRRMSTRHGAAGGVIVNVSSAAARLGSPGEYIDYAASKGAIDTMTIGLAKEVAADGIRVNAVRPGLIRTDIHASGGQPGRIERLATGVPMGRGGEPDEVAHAITWLCSPEASYVTGAILDVTGGR
ncbi:MULTISPECIES: SDR family oxidoreductase [unclassified Frankia]|uniref:SDR family oxidoreductase n=1 Tax=unclassified Frankia TaxID=2632575 RepID=UPI002AD1D05C|nr:MULTISPECIES: SDR family oxidoreductase [unclassified Frankia]